MADRHFTEAILEWYEENRRSLPWRGTTDPYPIWLSEIILQQTRIAQGSAYWERLMERFPTVQDLAAAPEDEVLRLWQGLGYYSRARNLLTAARQIAAAGRFPDTLEGLRALKGVGDYTAAAIGSIAFGLPAAVVDGNVYRVLARYFGIATPIGTTEGKKEFTGLAQELLPPRKAADFNQGMMDFGALQCTPQNPACTSCPLRKTCRACLEGRTALLPVKKNGPAIQTRHLTYLYLRCEGQTAFRKRPAGDIWQGLWEPLLFEGPLPETYPGARLLKQGVRHQLTHQLLVADFYFLKTEKKPSLPEGWIWMDEEEPARLGKPRLVERLLSLI